MKRLITLEDVRKNEDFAALIERANKNLEMMGYTEHGLRHVGYVSKTTSNILRTLGYDERMVELGAITGWIHDIGNAVNRHDHGLAGALLAEDLLKRMGMDMREIGLIISAIGNHEEETGFPVNELSAALIIADKSDAHRSRVRRKNFNINDIHDRVNMSILKNFVAIDTEKKVIRLFMYMDDTISSFMEYLEIYLSRMVLSEKAARVLGYDFQLIINDTVINNRRAVQKIKLEKLTQTRVSEE